MGKNRTSSIKLTEASLQLTGDTASPENGNRQKGRDREEQARARKAEQREDSHLGGLQVKPATSVTHHQGNLGCCSELAHLHAATLLGQHPSLGCDGHGALLSASSPGSPRTVC